MKFSIYQSWHNYYQTYDVSSHNHERQCPQLDISTMQVNIISYLLLVLLRIYFRYNEVCNPGYLFYKGDQNKGTGHFTQVVWKESTVLGIGRAESEEGGMKCAYIVGRYQPAGNYMGEYQQNVPKGSFDRNSYCATIKRGGFGFDQQDDLQQIIIGNSTLESPVQKTGRAEFQGPKKLE